MDIKTYKFEKEFMELLGNDVNTNYSINAILNKILEFYVVRNIDYRSKYIYKLTDDLNKYLDIPMYKRVTQHRLIKLISNKIIDNNLNNFIDKYVVVGYEKPTKINKLVVLIN